MPHDLHQMHRSPSLGGQRAHQCHRLPQGGLGQPGAIERHQHAQRALGIHCQYRPLLMQQQHRHRRLVYHALSHAAQGPAQQPGTSMTTEDDGIRATGVNGIQRHIGWVSNQGHSFRLQPHLLKLPGLLSKVGVGLINLLGKDARFHFQRGRQRVAG